MHHYPHHIGDYRKNTGHLTNNQDLAYRRLLEMYYDTEQPIPLETQWVARRLRVDTESVDLVLSDFFTKTESGWKHERCDQEIAKYYALAERNRANGRLGGRPKKTQSEPSGLPVGTRSQPTGKPTKNQEPRTKNQTIASHDSIVFDGSSFQNINGHLATWQAAYPAININAEMAKAASWLVANPKNKKSNYARFLNNWFSKAQDKAPPAGGGQRSDAPWRGAL